MNMIRNLFVMAALALTAPLQADTGDLEFSAGWIKQLPPSIPLRAGYLTIDNPGKQPHRIVAMASVSFEAVELHESRLVDDVMRMVELETIELPAGQRIELKPGGKHLMLKQPLQPLKLGDEIEVIVNFADGSSRPVLLEVRQ